MAAPTSLCTAFFPHTSLFNHSDTATLSCGITLHHRHWAFALAIYHNLDERILRIDATPDSHHTRPDSDYDRTGKAAAHQAYVVHCTFDAAQEVDTGKIQEVSSSHLELTGAFVGPTGNCVTAEGCRLPH